MQNQAVTEKINSDYWNCNNNFKKVKIYKSDIASQNG
jgi:hypothetical protein